MLDELEIQEMVDEVLDHKEEMDGRFRGMTYAEGIINALDWVLEFTDEPPFRKEEL